MPEVEPEITDEALVALAQKGDAQAFDELVRRHSPRLYRLAMGMMRDHAEAMDALQDGLLNAWRRLDGFRGDAAFGSWVYRVTSNACLMRLRKRRRRPEVPLEVRAPGFDDDGHWERPVEDLAPRVDELYENRELGEVIRQGMEQLPDNYKAVFVLADLELMSMQEIADTLDLTVPNVKTRLHRARLRLREHLADYLAGHPHANVTG